MHVQKITYGTIVAVALTALAAGSAAASTGAATAAVSTSKAGAKQVTLTVSLHTELQCGRLPGSAALVLTLPAKAHVATSVPASAVLIGGKAARRVVVSGHTLTISPAAPRGMLCDSIRMGVAKIVVLPAAGLGNPKAAGTYSVRASHAAETFAAPLKITT